MLVDVSRQSSQPLTTRDFQRDTELLATVCSEYLTHNDSDWEKAVAQHPDPASLVAAADYHGVLPLFARALSMACISCEGAQVRAREVAFHNLSLTAELVKLTGSLQELGIQCLAYKGPVLAQQLYGDVTLRQYRDLDILTAAADVVRARDALRELGYQDTEESSSIPFTRYVDSEWFCQWQMRGTRSGTFIELHWSFFPGQASLKFPAREAIDAGVDIDIAGERLKALDLHDLALVLSAHGAKHSWYRLGWLADLALVLRNFTDDDAIDLLNDASRKGMKRILLISVALCNRALKLTLSEAFGSALSADPQAAALAESMHHTLCANVFTEDLLGETILSLRTRERWSDRLKIVSSLAFTPGPPEWRWIALPKWAECLYPLVRMVRAARYFPQLAKAGKRHGA